MWTNTEDADKDERLLREAVLPGLREINVYEGGFLLRRELSDEVEFAVLNLFASPGAVKSFAGEAA